MSSNNTNPAQTRAQFSYNRKQVQYLCNITETMFCNLQTDTATAFMEYYGAGMFSNPEAVLTSEAFMNWWCYHWNAIDDRVIIHELYHIRPSSRYSWYRQMHQYMFDGASGHGETLLKDFNDMRKAFEAAIKPIAA